MICELCYEEINPNDATLVLQSWVCQSCEAAWSHSGESLAYAISGVFATKEDPRINR